MTSWRDKARCTDPDVVGSDGADLFFATSGAKLDEAKAVCRGCAVRWECLEANLLVEHGCWGGLSQRQRRRVRKLMAAGATLREAVAVVEIDGRKRRQAPA